MWFIACILVRALITLYAYVRPCNRILGFLSLIPALGFAIIYIFGLRKVGLETGGKPIWWNNLRPIHALLWGIFSISTLMGYRHSYIALIADTTIGIIAFTQRFSVAKKLRD